MADLFGKGRTHGSMRHVTGMFRLKHELSARCNYPDFRIVRQGRQSAGYFGPIEHYNLNVIISVGYRVNSQQGTRFRQWATRILA